jgi:ATP-dependent Lon protease
MAIKTDTSKNKSPRKYSREDKRLKKKQVESSDSDSDESYDEEDEEEDNDDPPMNNKEYQKFLSKIFPSKYMNSKVKENDKKETKKNDKKETKKNKSKKKKSKKNKSKNNKRRKEETESDSDSESDEEEVDNIDSKKKKYQKFNLIFTIGGKPKKNSEYDEDDEEWEEDSEYDSDYDEDDSEYEEDSEYDEEETDEEDEEETDEDEDDEEEVDDDKKKKTKNKKEEYTMEDLDQNKKLVETLKQQKSSAVTRELIKVSEQKIKEIEKIINKQDAKEKNKNLITFRKKINNKNVMNDYEFFKKMNVQDQSKIITELDEINKICKIEKPYRLTILEKDISPEYKACAIKKINMLRYMEPGGGEFYKIKNWIDTFMQIPFNTTKNLSITMDDGQDKCHEFMENSKNTLDNAVYGLNDAKLQIMQMLGQWVTNPKAIGNAIAIHGPMGTGKTTLVKEGISKILGRDFAFIALGGATDSSFLEGHSYTYEGSTWGQIVQIIIKSKCMNPVIYFDELDKVSDTPKGEEIIGILTHLTDTSQNNQFHDKYFSEIDFDLSKCLFIFSYNDESKVNPILKDRMYRITTKGYESKEKIVIANNHLLPNIRSQVLFEEKDIIFPHDVLKYIIDTFTNDEKGVRNLKRSLEIIYTKLNLYRLMKPGTKLFDDQPTLEVEFPNFTLTNDIVNKLIKRDENSNQFMHSLYV